MSHRQSSSYEPHTLCAGGRFQDVHMSLRPSGRETLLRDRDVPPPQAVYVSLERERAGLCAIGIGSMRWSIARALGQVAARSTGLEPIPFEAYPMPKADAHRQVRTQREMSQRDTQAIQLPVEPQPRWCMWPSRVPIY